MRGETQALVHLFCALLRLSCPDELGRRQSSLQSSGLLCAATAQHTREGTLPRGSHLLSASLPHLLHGAWGYSPDMGLWTLTQQWQDSAKGLIEVSDFRRHIKSKVSILKTNKDLNFSMLYIFSGWPVEFCPWTAVNSPEALSFRHCGSFGSLLLNCRID